ncbi:phosphomannomutase [Aliiroseovarius subalbicans]|uniref:phosphomannomutase n=1 Tax=Aliiroseovarius subalbicans TaxID=2925840 RepID=UPI001F59C80B|nr:phosphomannomutase [Aliiroseovarius subalbicans]MCI2401170.1 phosphomannomutase [Aliiroseovarius subalbicans]
MPPKFGTSGLRGLVSELTPGLISSYVRAFLESCPHGGGVYVGWDLRPSSPDIANAVIDTVRAAGLEAVNCGPVPTPTLALASMSRGYAAIMVTGSHIPADRNGLKFYVPGGEISKEDEARINTAYVDGTVSTEGGTGSLEHADDCARNYVDRYRATFGGEALSGLRIGVYQHSSVARDIMADAVCALGGDVVLLGRSDIFIPVDTEAVDPETRILLRDWVRENELDAVISTDGDGDRPMLADVSGRIVPGDVLGVLTARFLGAHVICTPVSSNGMVAEMEGFTDLLRTRIGSPYVIAAMEKVLADRPDARVVGYEANGGFLLGYTAQGPAGALPPLMTRDSLLPVLAPLADARARGCGLRGLVAGLPARFTAADRLTGIDPQVSSPFLADLVDDPDARRDFFSEMPAEAGLDLTDGLRVTFDGGDVVHLRPSGNAPEFRCYAESASPDAADHLVKIHLARLQEYFG